MTQDPLALSQFSDRTGVPRLVVEALACRRGGRLIFRDLAFSLAGGEAIALTGRNGAGKSSLLALLCGRLQPDEGRIALEPDDDTPLAERCHWLGHRDGLKTALTAAENLRFAADLLGGGGLAPEAALAAVGLPHVAALPVAYLSAGQRRRVGLARLLLAPRPFWLLDEPAAALDLAAQALLVELMRGQLRRGGAILAATHGPLGLAEARELRIGP